jgi:hypothetical protein
VLPLHECADPTAAECATEPLHSVADSVANSAAAGVAPTETSCS